MKHSLPVVEQSGDPADRAPLMVAVGERLVSVVDTGDGRTGLRFVNLLVDAGAARLDSANEVNLDMRVVIRGTPRSPAARPRSELLEANADLVLGSARPAFARLFVSACAHWVNS